MMEKKLCKDYKIQVYKLLQLINNKMPFIMIKKRISKNEKCIQ